MSRKDRDECAFCGKVRNLVADLVIDAFLIIGSDGSQASLKLKHPLCRHCFRMLGNEKEQPQVHLSSGGVRKRLSQRQHEVLFLARKRAEKKALQEELVWADDD
jgi:hypothetical protein